MATSPNVLTVPAKLGADNLQDFVKLAKTRAGTLNYGSVGPGSSAHLAMEMFKQEAKIDLTQIPYPGFPQVISAIIGGDVQAGFMVPAIAMPQVKDGRVKALAITSLEPSDALPGIPTMASQGYPGFEAISWNAILRRPARPRPSSSGSIASWPASSAARPCASNCCCSTSRRRRPRPKRSRSASATRKRAGTA